MKLFTSGVMLLTSLTIVAAAVADMPNHFVNMFKPNSMGQAAGAAFNARPKDGAVGADSNHRPFARAAKPVFGSQMMSHGEAMPFGSRPKGYVPAGEFKPNHVPRAANAPFNFYPAGHGVGGSGFMPEHIAHSSDGGFKSNHVARAATSFFDSRPAGHGAGDAGFMPEAMAHGTDGGFKSKHVARAANARFDFLPTTGQGTGGAGFMPEPMAHGTEGGFKPNHIARGINAAFEGFPKSMEHGVGGGFDSQAMAHIPGAGSNPHHFVRSVGAASSQPTERPLWETTKPTDPDPRFTSIDINHPHVELLVHHPNTTHNLKALNIAGMYQCSENNFEGQCTWVRADGGACHNSIHQASMGPDQGLDCTMYSNWNCENDRGNDQPVSGFRWPGVSNFVTNEWAFSNGFSIGPYSYRCQWDGVGGGSKGS